MIQKNLQGENNVNLSFLMVWIFFRFANMIADGLTKFSSKQLWTKLRTIRASYLSGKLSSLVKNECNVFIPEDHLNMNLEKMSEYLRLSNTSAETLNLSKEISQSFYQNLQPNSVFSFFQ